MRLLQVVPFPVTAKNSIGGIRKSLEATGFKQVQNNQPVFPDRIISRNLHPFFHFGQQFALQHFFRDEYHILKSFSMAVTMTDDHWFLYA